MIMYSGNYEGSLITRMSCFSRILARTKIPRLHSKLFSVFFNVNIHFCPKVQTFWGILRMTCLLHTLKFRRKCIEYLSYIEKYENHGV